MSGKAHKDLLCCQMLRVKLYPLCDPRVYKERVGDVG